MPEIKNSFIKGRMNLDLDKRIIPNGEYGEALNIQVSTSEDSDVGSVQNIIGNTKISTFLDGLTNLELICIGSISDEKKNRFYWFVVASDINSGADLASAIIEYNVEADPATAVTPIVIDSDNTRLEFSSDNYITGINIVDDILFFTDGLTEPKKINIEHFRLNSHTDIYDTTNSAFIQSNFFVDNVSVGAFTKEDITVIKQKPTKPPVLEFTTTPTVVYDDNGLVTMQPFSFLPYINNSALTSLTIDFDLVNAVAVDAGFIYQVNGVAQDYTTLNPNATYDFTSSGGSYPYAYNIIDAVQGVPFNQGDIVLMSDPNAPGSLPNNAQIRLEVVTITYQGGFLADATSGATQSSNDPVFAQVQFEVLSIDPGVNVNEISFNYVVENPDDILYENDFVRFSYRYKYQDGEYSAFGPFTQAAFLPGIFNIHPTREPYNVAMENNIRKITLRDFVTYDIPKEVVEIDLLVKLENSTVIYSVDTIKPKQADGSTDNPAWHTVDGTNSTITFDNNTTEAASDTGYYELTTDLVYAAIAEKQFLRPYDNVPKKAKAQDFTAGRLIYGNYIQNIDLSPVNYNAMRLNLENRSFHDSSTNSFVTGQKSIKSQRTYQTGITYLDIYGRETPVFTSNENNSLKIPFLDSSGATNASKSSRLYVNNLKDLNINNFTNETPGFDPVYFKIFIKETASEYYNLVLDRIYRAKEDGNLWLSFPSSDRDKIKKDDFIILKKAIEVDQQVSDENKFKVIDIKNEAPEFIRTKFQSIGTLDGQGTISGTGGLYPDINTQPAEQKNKITISKQAFANENVNELIPLAEQGETIALSFSKLSGSTQLVSRKYTLIAIEEIITSTDVYSLTLDTPIFSQDSWIESSTGVLDADLKTQFFLAKNKQWEEFQGRFFVKILRNLITAQFLENQIGFSATENILISINQLFSLIDPNLYLAKPQTFQSSTANTTNNDSSKAKWQTSLEFGGSTVTSGWFIDGARFVSHQPTVSSDLSLSAFFDQPLGTPGSNGLKFDVSTSSNLIKSGHSPNTPVSNTFTTNGWIYNSYQTTFGIGGANAVDNDFLPGQGGWVDGLEGIIEADSDYNGPGKDKSWRSQIGPIGSVGEDVYGAQGTQGFFMHLSFSGVGTQLHNGTGLNASSVAVEDFYDSSSTDCRINQLADSDARLNLQAIDNFNCQANPKDKVCNILQNSSLNTTATENQWNPAGHPNLGNFNQTNKDFIENLTQGSRFKFANDSSDTVFTIKNVYVKRIYNHTAWNKRIVWNPQLSVLQEDTGTVHYKWHNFVYHCINNNDADAINAFNDLQDTIKDFASPDNRRVCYILELDENPDNLINNPENLAGPSTTVESTFIEFIEENYENGVNPVSDNPAIFETEPKENLNLDIFYEASQAYPIELDKNTTTATSNGYANPDNRKGYLIGAVGDRVRCYNFDDANIQSQNFGAGTVNYIDNKVKSWDGDIVEIQPGFNTLNNTLASGSAATLNSLTDQTELYLDKDVQFYKIDDSYVQMTIEEVIEINPGATNITKIRVKPKVKRVGLSYFNCFSFGNGVESNRIRDDFNRVFITNGVKASTTLQEQYKQDNRTSGLIFSGIYNKNTSLNDLNQFIMADKITKELEPTYGSIQKLFARDSDLIAFCEDKVVQIAADKDIIFNADGNPQLTASNKVLGQSRPFVGEYGISKNPESFASSSYRAYFADKQRGAVLRLSMDGLTRMSSAGMKDWFRDKFKGDYFNIVGSYDTNKDTYNLTFDSGANFDDSADFKDILSSVTVSYKESVKGWESFKGFILESGLSCVNSYFTFRDGNLYSHDNQTRNNFYNDQQVSFISTIINKEPTTVKHFNTLNYDGEKGWDCNFIETDLNTGDTLHHFINKENKWFTSIVDNGTELLSNGVLVSPINDSISFQGLGYPTNIEDI